MNIVWTILQLDCKPQEDGKSDIVVTVHWSCAAEKEGQSASIYGAQGVAYNPNEQFTPYQELTQEQILGWCFTDEEKAEQESRAVDELEKKVNPPAVNKLLPWAA